ncbi:MAG: carboxypeptidase regulatory-like domain-containing protein [Betaproteobacteria bacterium]
MLIVLAVLSGLSAVAGAQTRPAAGHASAQVTGIHGAVTTQGGAVFLPGVVVTLVDPAGATVSETTTDGVGKYAFVDVRPGVYTVRATLDGFADGVKPSVLVSANQNLAIDFDLGIAKLSEKVEVQGGVDEVPLNASPTLTTEGGEALDIGPIAGDNFQALLPTLPGVVRSLDGHISIKGASPTESSVQVDAANVTDPSTGELGFDLPNDAVSSVDVLTNPYSAEYGRFSSGVTMLNTSHGGAKWAITPNGFVPRLFRSQTNWWHIEGIRSFRPRVAISGPLVKDTVFLFSNVLYRYFRTPISGLPDDETPRFSEVKTFSRIDANVSPRNLFNVTVATFPRQVDMANLNTFNRKSVSTNFRQGGFNAAMTDRATLSDSQLLESTIAVKQYNVRVLGQGTADMEITPDGNLGNYFSRQSRRSRTYQWVESLTMNMKGATGEHLVKIGSDILQVGYDGTSASSPVDILGEDGRLLQRIVFGAPGLTTAQSVSSAEMALLGQDHWRVNDRLMFEVGGRVDRDGVLRRWNLTPRTGFAVGLQSQAQTVLRGGIGLFYDRTPLNVGAFESFEPRTVTTYGLDAVPLSSIAYVNRTAPDMRTPHSRIWNLELDHRFNDQWSAKVNYLQRFGQNEFIVNPTITAGMPELLLSSTGHSRYHETEITIRYARPGGSETTVSYVRSRAETDLNSYDAFFGNSRNPIIQPNQYGLANTDTPNRVIIRGSYLLPWNVSFQPLLDLHNGFPYSIVAEDQSFVGRRNSGGRYPVFASFDFSASKPVKIWKYRAVLGVRLFDALNRFNPRDVQNNLASPAFGSFYNTVPRDFQTFVQLQVGKH